MDNYKEDEDRYSYYPAPNSFSPYPAKCKVTCSRYMQLKEVSTQLIFWRNIILQFESLTFLIVRLEEYIFLCVYSWLLQQCLSAAFFLDLINLNLQYLNYIYYLLTLYRNSWERKMICYWKYEHVYVDDHFYWPSNRFSFSLLTFFFIILLDSNLFQEYNWL